MKIKIIILLGIFIFVQNITAQAIESQEKLTRIAIASSDKIKYESKLLDSPPRLIIKFDTPNVFGKLLKNTYLNEGVIKNITVSYYPDRLCSGILLRYPRCQPSHLKASPRNLLCSIWECAVHVKRWLQNPYGYLQDVLIP